MIFATLLDLIASLLVPVTDLVLPAIPSIVVDTIYTAIRYIRTGAQYVIWFLWTPRFFTAVIGFLINFYIFLYGLDLAWKAINLLKLKRKDD